MAMTGRQRHPIYAAVGRHIGSMYTSAYVRQAYHSHESVGNIGADRPIGFRAGDLGAAADTISDAAPRSMCELVMVTYITLIHFTQQGIENVKDTVKRADAVKKSAKKYGVNMSQIYWTLGQYDLVTIIEAKDEKAAAAFGLAVGSSGSVRMETLRAFNKSEMSAILKAMP